MRFNKLNLYKNAIGESAKSLADIIRKSYQDSSPPPKKNKHRENYHFEMNESPSTSVNNYIMYLHVYT